MITERQINFSGYIDIDSFFILLHCKDFFPNSREEEKHPDRLHKIRPV